MTTEQLSTLPPGTPLLDLATGRVRPLSRVNAAGVWLKGEDGRERPFARRPDWVELPKGSRGGCTGG